MNIFKSCTLYILTIFCLLTFFRENGFAWSYYVNGNAIYSGSESVSNGKKTTSTTEAQIATFGTDLRLTNTINIHGDIKGTWGRTDSKKTYTLAPSGFIDIRNDYFGSNIGYLSNTRTKTSGDKTISESKNANMSVAIPLFPRVSLNYSETVTRDDKPVRKMDTNESIMNLNANYTLKDINFNYNFSSLKSDNRISDTTIENPDQQAAISFRRLMLGDKLRFSFNLGKSDSKTINESLSGRPQFFDDEKLVERGFYSENNTPETSSLLSDSSDLTDNDRGSAAEIESTGEVINLNGEYRNIGFKLDGLKNVEISKLYIYVNPGQNVIAEDAKIFGWKAYSKNIDSNQWTEITGLTDRYNETYSRFELLFNQPTAGLYFKAVNETYDVAAATIDVTEIEAIGYLYEKKMLKGTTTVDREFAGMNLNYNITEKISLSTSLNYDKSNQSQSSDQIAEGSPTDLSIANINWGVSGSYILSGNMSLFGNYQLQRSDSDSGEDSGSNIYTFALNSTPMRTIRSSFTLNRSESLRSGEMLNQANSGNLNVSLAFFKGVDLSTNFTLSNSESSSGSKTLGRAIGTYLTLRPRKSVNLVINGTTSVSSNTYSDKKDSDSFSDSLNLRMNINPSQHINLSTNLKISPKSAQHYSISTRLPGDMQIGLIYTLSDTRTETKDLSISWNISRFIFLTSSFRVTDQSNGDSSKFYTIALNLRT